MSGQQSIPQKPKIRAPAIWRKRGCQCRQRVLLCFGLPLLPPSVTLLGVAYGTNLDFGVFHILGLVLIIVSVSCIFGAIIITVYRKYILSKDPKKVGHVEGPDVCSRTPKSSSGMLSSPTDDVKLVRMVQISKTSVAAECETKPRSRKTEKRKHRKSRTKLPPVKEEDGRARFEKSMEEREKNGKKCHKRTKSESRRGFDEHMSRVSEPDKVPLTKKHLNMFHVLDNQGSQDSLQLKRSLSMSDIGDSASERLSIDVQDSPRFNRRPQGDTTGSLTSRPVLVHTSSTRTGVRTSRFTSLL